MTSTAAESPLVALYYDSGGYVETLRPPAVLTPESPIGLMGRQVAGKAFLDAYLSHGTWEQLVAVTPNEASARTLFETCRSHASSHDRRRRLRVFDLRRFHDEFLPAPPATQLYFPNPPDARFAWARRTGPPHGFAVSGVTHTLCSPLAVEVLRGLVTEPWEEYDRLICTSVSVERMVRSVTDDWAGYLRERHGGDPRPRIGLETIPLGVDVEKYHPTSPEERKAARRPLGLADDEMALLFVGRLSHHAKAHPFPMFRGAAEAAAATGRKIRLLMAGWAASERILEEFRRAAGALAPGVEVTFLDGTDPSVRFGVWRAADAFVSLPDNIQETFGLVILEAMASGLPVVASDWDGYRDLVSDGETGFLVPTASPRGAAPDLTSRLLLGELSYDHFLARATQAVSVDAAAAAASIARLAADADLARRMGEAGRRRAEGHFSWARIVGRYEALWHEQEAQRLDVRAKDDAREKEDVGASRTGPPPTPPRPEAYPPLERTFASYPTRWLGDGASVTAAPDALDRLDVLLGLPLTNHEAETRCGRADVLRAALAGEPGSRTLGELMRAFRDEGVAEQAGRATVAWLLKYDLLRLTNPLRHGPLRHDPLPPTGPKAPNAAPPAGAD
jgi:glycosyltransferase involved in cell wall biosynthesis